MCEGISLWLQPEEFCVELQWFKAAWGSPSVIACRAMSGEQATAPDFAVTPYTRRLPWCLLVKHPH